MHPLSIGIYDIAIACYRFVISLAALYNVKAKLWLAGRRNWAGLLQEAIQPLREAGRPIVWVHCASLGEFEQGRPVIEALRMQYPNAGVVLTFFSPSGYQIRRNYAYADVVCYMPLDTRRNAAAFVKILQPRLAIFVKYEFWYHHLQALFKAGVPVLLIAALFRPGQLFFRWYGGAFRELLKGFGRIFTQNEAAAALLRQAGISRVEVAGDTRVDRVMQMAAQPPAYEIVRSFAGDSPLLVCGSTWPQDEAILTPFVNRELPEDWKVVVAPHEISENHLAGLEKMLPGVTVRYSQFTPTSAAGARVLIVDNIGMLAFLYQYGRLAYIGGGFGHGIHNTLEPAAFGLPVIFGPRYGKFEEAVYLAQQGGFFSISSGETLGKAFQHLMNENNYRDAAAKVKQYLHERQGATTRVMDYLAANQWLDQR